MEFHNYKSISLMVRIWKENPDGDFRASALNVQTQETQYFSSITALFEFIAYQSEQVDAAERISSNIPDHAEA